MKTYAEKLKDPRWQKKRLEILERDGWKCTKCGDDTEELQVHHLRYGKEPWTTDNYDMITLCKTCHEVIETMKGAQWPLNEHGIIALKYRHRKADAITHFTFQKDFFTVKFSDPEYGNLLRGFEGEMLKTIYKLFGAYVINGVIGKIKKTPQLPDISAIKKSLGI